MSREAAREERAAEEDARRMRLDMLRQAALAGCIVKFATTGLVPSDNAEERERFRAEADTFIARRAEQIAQAMMAEIERTPQP